jgi:hypothetical protein
MFDNIALDNALHGRCRLCGDPGAPHRFEVSDGQSWIRNEVQCVCLHHTTVIFQLEGRLLTEAHPIGPVTTEETTDDTGRQGHDRDNS